MRLNVIATKRTARLAVALMLALCAAVPGLFAWDNHEQLSARALATQDWTSRALKAESLDDFLAATKGDLAKTLEAVEAKARKDYSSYKPLPAPLVFDPTAEGSALRSSFVGAIRVNPTMPFALFLQVPVGGDPKGRPDIEWKAVALGAVRVPVALVGLQSGEIVTALEVVETACDEPDYGMDWGLYSDNGTEWGARYGFGVQPWGNPKLSYGTQAPFHMSFDNEPGILHALASWTGESNAGYRVDLYTALSRLAFATGHEYWGWRFAGWALHYIQDLTQPYHASLMPSKSTFDLIMMNAFGSKAEKDAAVTLLSNRHLIFENYQYSILAAWKGDPSANPAFAALVGTDAPIQLPKDISGKKWVIGVVAAQARARSEALDKAVVATFPAKYVNDPAFDYGAWQDQNDSAYDPYADLLAKNPDAVKAFDLVLAKSLAATGDVTRGYLAVMAQNVK